MQIVFGIKSKMFIDPFKLEEFQFMAKLKTKCTQLCPDQSNLYMESEGLILLTMLSDFAHSFLFYKDKCTDKNHLEDLALCLQDRQVQLKIIAIYFALYYLEWD